MDSVFIFYQELRCGGETSPKHLPGGFACLRSICQVTTNNNGIEKTLSSVMATTSAVGPATLDHGFQGTLACNAFAATGAAIKT